MLAESVKADYKDYIALTVALFRALLPMAIVIILVLLLVTLLFNRVG